MKRMRFAALVVGIGLLAGACGSQRGTNSNAAPQPRTATPGGIDSLPAAAQKFCLAAMAFDNDYLAFIAGKGGTQASIQAEADQVHPLAVAAGSSAWSDWTTLSSAHSPDAVIAAGDQLDRDCGE